MRGTLGKRSTTGALSLLVLCGAVPATGSPAWGQEASSSAASDGRVSSWRIAGQVGSYFTWSRFSSDWPDAAVEGFDSHQAHFDLSDAAGNRFRVEMGAADGAVLVPGAYEDTLGNPEHGVTEPDRNRLSVFDLGGGGASCFNSTGRFQIDELAWDAVTGRPTRFRGSWELHCHGQDETLSGSIALNASSPAAPLPPPPAPADPVERYVSQVYNDLFDRNPDPTGLMTWSASLKAGTPYGSVANGITYSREFRSGLIADSYEHYLFREPDPTGLENWLAQMARGLHIEQMEAGFIASSEFYSQAGGTDADWVAELYWSVLGREAGDDEIAFWEDQLAGGRGYNSVALGFLYSTEHLTHVVDGYYQHLLRRGIDPAGAQTWVTALQRGARDEEIIASIVSSREYRERVGTWVTRFLRSEAYTDVVYLDYSSSLDCTTVDEDGSDFVISHDYGSTVITDAAFDAYCHGRVVELYPVDDTSFPSGELVEVRRSPYTSVRSTSGVSQHTYEKVSATVEPL